MHARHAPPGTKAKELNVDSAMMGKRVVSVISTKNNITTHNHFILLFV